MSTVNYTFAGGAATLTLNDPERGNPVCPPMMAEFATAIRRARDDDARVIVLRSTGRFFSVGGDIAGFGAAESPGGYIDELAEDLHRAIADLHALDAVVVSVVQGAAAGAGFPLACAADVVIAASSASFTLAYTRIGLTPDGGSTLLTSTLGLHRSLYLALLNPALTSSQALETGLVAQVHPDGELDEAADKVVAALLAGSRTAQVGAKRLLRNQAQPAPESAMRRETVSIRTAADSPDGREGVQAFLAKRKPAFPSTT
jgi:2-(1,2-epoxy-1,2-dihydrophenyl)acetyl-CoA isomerase